MILECYKISRFGKIKKDQKPISFKDFKENEKVALKFEILKKVSNNAFLRIIKIKKEGKINKEFWETFFVKGSPINFYKYNQDVLVFGTSKKILDGSELTPNEKEKYIKEGFKSFYALKPQEPIKFLNKQEMKKTLNELKKNKIGFINDDFFVSIEKEIVPFKKTKTMQKELEKEEPEPICFFSFNNKIKLYTHIRDYDGLASYLEKYFEEIFFDMEQGCLKVILKDDNNIYVGETILKQKVGQILRREVGNFDPALINKISDYIKKTSLFKKNVRKEGIVAFKNTTINLYNNKEYKIKEDEYFENMIPWNLITKEEYDKRIKEQKFINNIYKNLFPEKKWKDTKHFLHSLMFSIMTKNTQYDKITVFIGKGGEGKSEYLNRIKTIIGESSASGESFSNLEGNFSPINLQHKLLNIDPDLENKIYKNTSIIKKIATKDDLRGEAKGGKTIIFKNYCSVIISTNEFFKIKEIGLSEAIRRRFNFLRFNKKPKKTKKYFEMRFNEKVIETELFEIVELYKKIKGSSIASLENIKSYNHNVCYENFVLINNEVLQWFNNIESTIKTEKKTTEQWYGQYKEWSKKANVDVLSKVYFLPRLEGLLSEKNKKIIIEKSEHIWKEMGKIDYDVD